MFADFFTSTLDNTLYFFLKYVPYVLPFALGLLAWELWIKYIQTAYVRKMEWVLLQIKVPRDVFKTPEAMELFFQAALFQTGGMGTWYHKYWLGNVPHWFSLELVSIEGRIYFFIYTQKRFVSVIEAQLYAQYPQAEIVETEDYTRMVPEFKKGAGWGMFGCEYALSKEDPIPIKTYVDWGLDKAGGMDEEQKIDPITPIIEYFGSMGKGEQAWLQILVQPANWARYDDPKHWFKKIKWQDSGKAILKDLRAKLEKPVVEEGASRRLTKGEQDTLTAIERSLTKYGFDTSIRIIYMGNNEHFDGTKIASLLAVFQQFNAGPDLNNFKKINVTDFDYPWQDFSGNKRIKLKHDLLEAYKSRSYSHYKSKPPFVLNTEELATIFHFPGRVIETPTFKRIDSKKSEPPPNLPM